MRMSDIKYRIRVRTVEGPNKYTSYASFDKIPESVQVGVALLDAATDGDGVAILLGVGTKYPSSTYKGASAYTIEGNWS